MQDFGNDADELDDEESYLFDEEEGLDEGADESEPIIPCPFCHHDIYEDAVRCPHCERYISDDDRRKKKSWLIIIGAALCLYIVYRWIVP